MACCGWTVAAHRWGGTFMAMLRPPANWTIGFMFTSFCLDKLSGVQDLAQFRRQLLAQVRASRKAAGVLWRSAIFSWP